MFDLFLLQLKDFVSFYALYADFQSEKDRKQKKDAI